jgi:hypothetical protein
MNFILEAVPSTFFNRGTRKMNFSLVGGPYPKRELVLGL